MITVKKTIQFTKIADVPFRMICLLRSLWLYTTQNRNETQAQIKFTAEEFLRLAVAGTATLLFPPPPPLPPGAQARVLGAGQSNEQSSANGGNGQGKSEGSTVEGLVKGNDDGLVIAAEFAAVSTHELEGAFGAFGASAEQEDLIKWIRGQ